MIWIVTNGMTKPLLDMNTDNVDPDICVFIEAKTEKEAEENVRKMLEQFKTEHEDEGWLPSGDDLLSTEHLEARPVSTITNNVCYLWTIPIN